MNYTVYVVDGVQPRSLSPRGDAAVGVGVGFDGMRQIRNLPDTCLLQIISRGGLRSCTTIFRVDMTYSNPTNRSF